MSESNDAVFEAMMKEAVAANFRAKMNAMPSKEETLREHPFSEHHNRRMEKLFALERRTPFVQNFRTLAKAACLVLCAAAVLFSAVLAVNPQVRAAVWETIVRFFDRHIEIEYREPDTSTTKTAQDFTPQYLPQGYTLTHEEDLGDIYTAIYGTADGGMIVFGVNPPGLFNVDSEYLSYYTETHGGITYHINESPDAERYSVVAWLQDDFMFDLNGSVSIDELLSMAQSVE
ncbi:MAG: DUF4367 domain-containing protein [Oscillospiraceae bacterium]|nr:DUF4367 domain-containing protein [Oscillospiraceae bacterium]